MALALMIENVGVAPAESFTMFGLTSKRDTSNPLTIGMFGSGNKHAICVLLRMGIDPIIYCGNLRMEFFTKGIDFKGREANQVCVKLSGKNEQGKQVNRVEELSVVIDYGALDWGNVNMALREFVSNALDAQFENQNFDENTPRSELVKGIRQAIDTTNVVLVDENDMRAKAGTTRVYIPLDNAGIIETFHKNLGRWFLHFSEPASVCDKILKKNNRQFTPDNNSACLYRRGVFVRQYSQHGQQGNSLFDYNFGSELKIDESRNCNDYDVRAAASKNVKYAEKIVLSQYLKGMMGATEKTFENQLTWELSAGWNDDETATTKIRETWGEAFRLAYGDNAVVVQRGSVATIIAERIKNKGLNPIILPEIWWKAIRDNGGVTDEQALTNDEREGITYLPATDKVKACLEKYYNLSVLFNLNCNKSIPKIGCFQKVMDAGSQNLGFWKRGSEEIYIHTDCADSLLEKVILEEICHYFTEASDMSRDFQDWLIRFAIAAVGLAK